MTLVGGDFNMVPDEWFDRCPSMYTDSHCNTTLMQFMNVNSLFDVWKEKNPNRRQFSWVKPNGRARSRIDLWLISSEVLNCVSNVSMSAAPLTDHCVIEFTLKPDNYSKYYNNYWKCNAALLNSDNFVKDVKNMLKQILNDKEIDSSCKKWEYFKYKVRGLSIKFGKIICKQQKENEFNLVHKINLYCRKTELLEEDRIHLSSLQAQLDHLFTQRAQGAYIRSRAKWIEQGEKNSSDFFSLEKRRQERNKIDVLVTDDIECSDNVRITDEIYTFYVKLYSSSFSDEASSSFLESIKEHIPQINLAFKDLCDSDLTMKELDLAIKQMAINKAPGQDGLTSNFYKFFWEDVKELLFKAISECINSNNLMSTMKQGIITLLPKPGKDKRYIENLRPITLLNVDYKLLTHIIANRLKVDIDQIINETQSGFIKERSIHNNIRLVLDLLDYNFLIEDKGFILFLDFYKAFDSVEHPFILKALKYFGFGHKFIKLIDMLYNDINSSVSLPWGTSKRFDVERGIRQGCSCSPLLFILVAELLAILIKNSPDIEPLNVLGKNLSIIQLADDSTIFLKSPDQIRLVVKRIDSFSRASGLHLNLTHGYT